jgi:hypothetical protein
VKLRNPLSLIADHVLRECRLQNKETTRKQSKEIDEGSEDTESDVTIDYGKSDDDTETNSSSEDDDVDSDTNIMSYVVSKKRPSRKLVAELLPDGKKPKVMKMLLEASTCLLFTLFVPLTQVSFAFIYASWSIKRKTTVLPSAVEVATEAAESGKTESVSMENDMFIAHDDNNSEANKLKSAPTTLPARKGRARDDGDIGSESRIVSKTPQNKRPTRKVAVQANERKVMNYPLRAIKIV